MTITEQALKNAKTMPKKSGRAEYIKHLQGERLTRDQAIRAQCYACVSGEDTKPCVEALCSLTHYCQWNKKTE